jgi:WD40 repeat protein
MTNPGQAGVRVVETATGREVWAGTGVGGVAYSPDGQLRVLGTSEGGVAYSPDGQLLAVANKLLDAATGQEQADITRVNAAGDRLPRISRLVSNITSVFSPDGRRLARAVSDSEFQTTRIIVWDADTGKELSSVGGIGSFSHIAYSPDGRRLAAYGHGKVKVWDTDTGRELLTVPTRINVNAGSLAFRPDGHKLIVAGTHDGRPAIEVLDGTPR